MKVLAFVLSAAVAVVPYVVAAPAEELRPSGTRGFSFLPPAKCEDAPDRRQCQVAGPKAWTPDEQRVLETSLDRLSAHELVRGILVRARMNGYQGIRRYSSDTRRDPAAGHVTKFSPGFVLYTSKVVGITDAFFETAEVADPIAGYRFGDLILLHELIHAFDDRQRSIQAGFTEATGWLFKNNRWVFTKPVGISEYNGVFADTLTLYARGRYADAWKRDRSFATTMTFPLPTIQSLATPGESFADILAHLILDPTATSYLKRPVLDWFEAHVFPGLRADAARFPVDSTTP